MGFFSAWLMMILKKREQRTKDQREAFAIWMTGIRETLNRVGSDSIAPDNRDTALWENRLLLLSSRRTRDLIKKVNDSIPYYGTEDHEDWCKICHGDPNGEWQPFEKAMNELIEQLQ